MEQGCFNSNTGTGFKRQNCTVTMMEAERNSFEETLTANNSENAENESDTTEPLEPLEHAVIRSEVRILKHKKIILDEAIKMLVCFELCPRLIMQKLRQRNSPIVPKLIEVFDAGKSKIRQEQANASRPKSLPLEVRNMQGNLQHAEASVSVLVNPAHQARATAEQSRHQAPQHPHFPQQQGQATSLPSCRFLETLQQQQGQAASLPSCRFLETLQQRQGQATQIDCPEFKVPQTPPPQKQPRRHRQIQMPRQALNVEIPQMPPRQYRKILPRLEEQASEPQQVEFPKIFDSRPPHQQEQATHGFEIYTATKQQPIHQPSVDFPIFNASQFPHQQGQHASQPQFGFPQPPQQMQTLQKRQDVGYPMFNALPLSQQHATYPQQAFCFPTYSAAPQTQTLLVPQRETAQSSTYNIFYAGTD